MTGHSYSWVASWYHTNSCFGGITCKTPRNIKGCFSNNDALRTVQKVSNDDIGECGSTSYSKEEMRTKDFVSELNFFTQMEYDKDLWGLDNYGNLILITEEGATGITNIVHSNNSKNIVAIYDLNGNKIANVQKGFNIIVYGDGRVKKVVK